MRLRTRKCGETESAGRDVLLRRGQGERSADRTWSSDSSHDRHGGRLGASIPDRRGPAAAGALALSGRSVGVLGIPVTVSRRAEPARMWPDVGPYPRPSGSVREPRTTMVTFGVRLRTTRRSKTGLRCRAWWVGPTRWSPGRSHAVGGAKLRTARRGVALSSCSTCRSILGCEPRRATGRRSTSRRAP
jgi:hypothetical protein